MYLASQKNIFDKFVCLPADLWHFESHQLAKKAQKNAIFEAFFVFARVLSGRNVADWSKIIFRDANYSNLPPKKVWG